MAKKKELNQEEFSQESVALDFTELNFAPLKPYRQIIDIKDVATKRRYTKEQLLRFLENPQNHERQLREISNYYLVSSMHYRRIIDYFANMLTLDHIVVPVSVSKIDNSAFRSNYEKAVKFVENYSIKHEFAKIIRILLTDGIYFGYERQAGNSFMLQRLPTDQCKITGLEDKVWTFAFNFQYFNGNRLPLLDNYPEEFKKLYNKAQRTGEWWQELSSSNGAVCFKFDEDVIYSIPPLVSLLIDIMDLEEYKSLNKQKTKINNYKLLVQKIPMKKDARNEKDFVLTLQSVEKFHNNIKSALPEGVALVTTPMDIEDFSFEKSRQEEDFVGDAERNVYSSAGVSMLLFNSEKTGSIGLNKSIQVDEAFMFKILRQIEEFFRKRLAQVTSGAYQFKLVMPDITVYNRNEVFDKYIKASTYGFPKLLPAAALGLTPSELIALSALENKHLEILDSLIPLQSAHTASSKNEGPGRPQKNEDEMTDSGLETRDQNKNDNRADE